MHRRRVLLPILALMLGILACSSSEPLEVPLEPPPGGTDFFELPTGSPTPTRTQTPTVTPSPPPTATPTASRTPDLTEAARTACRDTLTTLAACVNDAVLRRLFQEGAPNQPVVNNSDPATLYRSEDLLAMLTASGVTLLHNNYTRPANCPLGTTCVLHVLLIEFPTAEAALEFFARVTQIAGLEAEAEIPVPNAAVWDAAKCATGTRPSSAEGAPAFAVSYCSVSVGRLHWGFNLSAYGELPAGLVEADLEDILAEVHDYLSVWR
jgi:hypothetical protein